MKWPQMSWPPGRVARRRLTAAALALTAFLSVVLAQRDVGIARDEATYIASGAKYARWWIDLVTFESGTASEKRITATFGGPEATDNNREHPPLMKTLFGLSRILFADKLGWASEVTASRLPNAAMNALLVVLVFLFACSFWGYGVGLISAVLVLLLPRAFFHAGLATFDAPMVTLWLGTILAYHRALASRRWCIALAVVFGLALATKHNAVMLPAVILPHYLWVAWRRSRPTAAVRLGERLVLFARAVIGVRPLVFAALAAGPLVLIAVWPWLWFDTIEHIRQWISFHTHHVHYHFEYLGVDRDHPPFPWHVVFVTTLFTVPTATLVAAAIGAAHLVTRARHGASADGDRAPALLLALSAAVAMGVFLLPSTPIFGAEKHWAPAIPTICVAAGIGVWAAATRLVRTMAGFHWFGPIPARFARAGVAAALGALVATAALSETAAAHPYALSHYTALAGGPAGGADLGMNRQFWGVAARGVLPFVALFAPDKGEPPVPVYSHDAQPAWGLYKKLGLLPDGMPDAGRETAGIAKSKIALVIHEKHFVRHDYLIWQSYGTVQPAYVLTVGGVPLVSVYVRSDLLQKRHNRVLQAQPE
jgi:4-amino-4-deoxy-L-arabinose transferase-like glycosyltransferase